MDKKIFEVEISSGGPESYKTSAVLDMPCTQAELHDALQKARIQDVNTCRNELTRIRYCPASETEQFGKEALQKQGGMVFRDSVLQGGIDLKAYGAARLEQQGYLLNTAGTGYIRRMGQAFHCDRSEPQPEWDMAME